MKTIKCKYKCLQVCSNAQILYSSTLTIHSTVELLQKPNDEFEVRDNKTARNSQTYYKNLKNLRLRLLQPVNYVIKLGFQL